MRIGFSGPSSKNSTFDLYTRSVPSSFYPEVEPERAADHPFRRNLVKLLRERAHKITVPPEAIQVANPLARNNSIIGT